MVNIKFCKNCATYQPDSYFYKRKIAGYKKDVLSRYCKRRTREEQKIRQKNKYKDPVYKQYAIKKRTRKTYTNIIEIITSIWNDV